MDHLSPIAALIVEANLVWRNRHPDTHPITTQQATYITGWLHEQGHLK